MKLLQIATDKDAKQQQQKQSKRQPKLDQHQSRANKLLLLTKGNLMNNVHFSISICKICKI